MLKLPPCPMPTLHAAPRRLSFPIDDSTTSQVVGRQFDPNLISRNDSNEVLSDSACNVRHHFRARF
jgi:hypothetical protein